MIRLDTQLRDFDAREVPIQATDPNARWRKFVQACNG